MKWTYLCSTSPVTWCEAQTATVYIHASMLRFHPNFDKFNSIIHACINPSKELSYMYVLQTSPILSQESPNTNLTILVFLPPPLSLLHLLSFTNKNHPIPYTSSTYRITILLILSALTCHLAQVADFPSVHTGFTVHPHNFNPYIYYCAVKRYNNNLFAL